MFYDNFKMLCERNGEKPTPVAQKLGCSSSNVVLWKTVRRLARPSCRELQTILGLTRNTSCLGTKKAPSPTDERALDDELLSKLTSLTPEEMQKVDAFVQGLLANR